MRILLVEDDPGQALGLRLALRDEGYTLDWLADGLDAQCALEREAFDLVLLDLGLPRRDGLSVLKRLRAAPRGEVPVLILSARDAIEDRVRGLDAGADDYLAKPFDVDELRARMRALLRRSQGRAQPLLAHAGIVLDPARREVTCNGRAVPMTPMEFRLLHLLLSRAGRVQTRAQLMEGLYGWQGDGSGNMLEVLVHNLRRKLGDQSIRTLRGVGYRID